MGVPDKPYEDLTRLEQRWFKIKQIPEFPLKVKYYGDCGLPLEYCEFLGEQLRNQAFEEAKNDTDLDPALVGDLKIDENDKKKQKRGGRGNVKAKKKAEPAQVKIGRVSRGKKKSVTHITGLSSYDKADEIVIQGDFIDECIDMIIQKFPQI